MMILDEMWYRCLVMHYEIMMIWQNGHGMAALEGFGDCISAAGSSPVRIGF
jgi:hypothetical protein